MGDMKKRKKKEKQEKKSEEVFHLSKSGKFEGKEKIVESCGDVEEKPSNEKQIKEQNKTLRNILIGIGVFILVFAVSFYFISSVKNFEYKGIKFNIIKEGKITFYHTSFPMTYESGEKAIYNLFLRKDPREPSRAKSKDGFLGLLIDLQ